MKTALNKCLAITRLASSPVLALQLGNGPKLRTLGSGELVRSLREIGKHGFLEIPENRLAYHALKRLYPSARGRKREVLTLVGPTGCGKSELTRELLKRWDAVGRDARVRSLNASEFAAQYVEAVDANSVSQFQNRYRKDIDLFVCEDLQALHNRPEAQRELVTTIDDISSHGGAVLLTAVRSPGEIKGLSPRLVNRCHGGVCLAIAAPCMASRTALLQHFARFQQLPLNGELAERIAQQVNGTGRELLGFLRQLNASLLQSRQTQPLASLVDQLLARQQIGIGVEIADVAKTTARYFEMTLQDLRGPRRAQPIVFARHLAIYLARELTPHQLQEIGRYFGGRNHSTVLHACQQIRTRLGEDAVVARHVEQIRTRLSNGGLSTRPTE